MNDVRPVEGKDAPLQAEEPWQAISQRYAWVLRFDLTVRAGMLAILPWLWVLLGKLPIGALIYGATGALLTLVVLAWIVWIPRRVALTRYLLRPLDVHMRTGYWWHTERSVAINRIQHLEVNQRPIERLLGLSTLALYTAGSHQSDLRVPGLPTLEAHRLKEHLLGKVAREEQADDDQR